MSSLYAVCSVSTIVYRPGESTLVLCLLVPRILRKVCFLDLNYKGQQKQQKWMSTGTDGSSSDGRSLGRPRRTRRGRTSVTLSGRGTRLPIGLNRVGDPGASLRACLSDEERPRRFRGHSYCPGWKSVKIVPFLNTVTLLLHCLKRYPNDWVQSLVQCITLRVISEKSSPPLPSTNCS